MRILVTGSRGLIGGSLVERLSARGPAVVGYDDDPYRSLVEIEIERARARRGWRPEHTWKAFCEARGRAG